MKKRLPKPESFAKRTVRRFQNGARTYLLFSGAGVAAIAAAPFAAIYRALKPLPDPAKIDQQKRIFKDINKSIRLAGEQLQNIDPFSGFDPFDPFGSEPWKQKHRKLHDMTDEEYERKNKSQDPE